jgi:hypothetical protein
MPLILVYFLSVWSYTWGAGRISKLTKNCPDKMKFVVRVVKPLSIGFIQPKAQVSEFDLQVLQPASLTRSSVVYHNRSTTPIADETEC